MNETYEAYANFADSVKEVGCHIIMIIGNNNEAIERYRKKAMEAEENGDSSNYFREWIDKLEAQNKLWLELEANLRMKYIEGDW